MKVPLVTALLLVLLAAGTQARSESKPNILFIAVDDLRPWIGAMGFPAAKTPNLDRLAARSVTFSKAYASAHGAILRALHCLQACDHRPQASMRIGTITGALRRSSPTTRP